MRVYKFLFVHIVVTARKPFYIENSAELGWQHGERMLYFDFQDNGAGFSPAAGIRLQIFLMSTETDNLRWLKG